MAKGKVYVMGIDQMVLPLTQALHSRGFGSHARQALRP